MTTEVFLKKFQEVLQRPASLTIEDKLEDLEEWDSLSMMATSLFLKTSFHIDISPEKLKEVQSVRELCDIASSNSQP